MTRASVPRRATAGAGCSVRGCARRYRRRPGGTRAAAWRTRRWEPGRPRIRWCARYGLGPPTTRPPAIRCAGPRASRWAPRRASSVPLDPAPDAPAPDAPAPPYPRDGRDGVLRPRGAAAAGCDRRQVPPVRRRGARPVNRQAHRAPGNLPRPADRAQPAGHGPRRPAAARKPYAALRPPPELNVPGQPKEPVGPVARRTAVPARPAAADPRWRRRQPSRPRASERPK